MMVPILGVSKFRVCYQNFDGLLALLVTEGRCMSLLDLMWFAPLDVGIQGVNQTERHDFNTVCHEFPSVFDGTLGRYTWSPVSLQLDPQVCPIWLKARRIPFGLKEELDCLVKQGVLELVPHAT